MSVARLDDDDGNVDDGNDDGGNVGDGLIKILEFTIHIFAACRQKSKMKDKRSLQTAKEKSICDFLLDLMFVFAHSITSLYKNFKI